MNCVSVLSGYGLGLSIGAQLSRFYPNTKAESILTCRRIPTKRNHEHVSVDILGNQFVTEYISWDKRMKDISMETDS
jgi:hypothetical protein